MNLRACALWVAPCSGRCSIRPLELPAGIQHRGSAPPQPPPPLPLTGTLPGSAER